MAVSASLQPPRYPSLLRYAESRDCRANVQAKIAEHGCVILCAPPGETSQEPEYQFTLGLWQTYQHPELICHGLSYQVGLLLLEEFCIKIRSGITYKVNASYLFLNRNYSFQFRPILSEQKTSSLHIGYTYYKMSDFPVLQVIWPDIKGYFPWEKECSPKSQLMQTIP